MKISESDKKELLKYLSEYKLMSLGTYYRKPWSAWVYYLFDDNFNLYFVSDPKTKHGKYIANNPKVSVAITDSNQNPKGKKVGLQASGVAKRLSSIKEVKDLVTAWNKRGFVPMTLKLITKVWKSRFYMIKLEEIQLFDEKQPEETEVRNWRV